MKNKVFILLFVTCFILMFSACGNDDVSGTVSEISSDESAASSDSEAFSFGSTEGYVYENKFLGIGCELDSDWEISSQEEILEMCELTEDVLEDSDALSKALEETTVLYDFFATNTKNNQSINICLEKISLLSPYNSPDAYVESSIEPLKEAFTSAGYTDVAAAKDTTTFMGEEHNCIRLQATANDTTIYEKIVCFSRENYMVVLTVFGYDLEDISDTLSKFYKLD